MAIGTVSMMMNGSRKLSNCAARIRYINRSASTSAKEVFELLSAKSRDGPYKAVWNDSFRTFLEIFCISAIPSPMVRPGAREAETVADLYRL